MSIEVIAAGALTTVQDAGRFGYQSSGVRQCGVMDEAAYEAAKLLVGGGEAVLEATISGPRLRFTVPTVIALTGADMKATLDGAPIPRYQPIAVSAGSSLAMAFAMSGCRAYIAVRGGVQVPPVMGSYATDFSSHIGGMEGRALKVGDVLPIISYGEAGIEEIISRAPKLSTPTYSDNVTVRVIMGPQEEFFTAKGVSDFLSMPYTVSMDSDRMGIRLEGAAIESSAGTDIVSDGIVFGSIQVTPSGKPIILMADHPTTGGYAKIATVLSLDLPKLAQLKPGGSVNFEKISSAEAQALYEI